MKKVFSKYIICLCLFISICQVISAQGKVVFNEPTNVKNIFDNFVAKNRAETTIKGWRIQIISTDDRRDMEATRSRFSTLYPSMPSAWKHVSPSYHVRVGAFRTKADLTQVLYKIKKDFPAAIAVQDDIQKYDLINY
jgi:hypothetical protein